MHGTPKARLDPETARIARGCEAVSLFVNDDCGTQVGPSSWLIPLNGWLFWVLVAFYLMQFQGILRDEPAWCSLLRAHRFSSHF